MPNDLNFDLARWLQDSAGRAANTGHAAGLSIFGNAAGEVGTSDLLNAFLNFQVPQDQINQQLNVLNQGVAAGQNRANQAVQSSNAARTGGRVSTARANNDIGGQAALAQQQGQAAIFQQAAQLEAQHRMAGLQAYIQKYGIDKNAQLALEQMQNAQMAALGQGIGSNGGLLAGLIPFL